MGVHRPRWRRGGTRGTGRADRPARRLSPRLTHFAVRARCRTMVRWVRALSSSPAVDPVDGLRHRGTTLVPDQVLGSRRAPVRTSSHYRVSGGYGKEGRCHRDRGQRGRGAAERDVPRGARRTATGCSPTSLARCDSTTSGTCRRTVWWSKPARMTCPAAGSSTATSKPCRAPSNCSPSHASARAAAEERA